MNFLQETEKDVVTIKVNLNRATMKEAEELKMMIKEIITNGIRKIVIDFSACEFLDSTFISALITSLKNATKENGKMVLANVHSEALSLMELTGTAKVFSFFPDVKSAIKSFQ